MFVVVRRSDTGERCRNSKLIREALKVEEVKARYRDLLMYEQPSLPLIESADHKPQKKKGRAGKEEL